MEKKKTIGVLGYGYVGKAVANGFKNIADIRIYDVKEQLRTHPLQEVCESDFIFLCVPTPMKSSGACDISIVQDAIEDCALYSTGVVIIKSTIPPGTTKKLAGTYSHLHLVFNPEFLTEKNSLNDFLHPSRVIIGSEDGKARMKVFNLYKQLHDTAPIFITDSVTAELAKYVSNCFLASKISYFNEVYDICTALHVNYDLLRELVVADPRIGASHTKMPGYHGRGFAGSCLPKDINAFICFCKSNGIDCSFLEAVLQKNRMVRHE